MQIVLTWCVYTEFAVTMYICQAICFIHFVHLWIEIYEAFGLQSITGVFLDVGSGKYQAVSCVLAHLTRLFWLEK